MRDLARARAYHLLGALIAGDPPAVRRARDNPLLSEWLAPWSDSELLASHYHCFGRNAFPYGGVYLSPEGLISGDGDDLSCALARLGSLERRGDREGAARELAVLLAWLPPFAIAAAAVSGPPWRPIVALAVDLIGAHADELDVSPLVPRLTGFSVDDRTGLAGVAAALCLPCSSGFLLTSDDLRRLARFLRLPAGFGARRQQARQLLDSGASYGRAADVLGGFEAVVSRAVDDLVSLAERPGFLRACAPWIEQCAATRDTLVRMQAELSSAGDVRAADG